MSTDRSIADANVNVGRYLAEGIKAIDEQLGAGYAAANPVLLAAYIKACSVESSGAVLADELGNGLDEIGRHMSTIGAGILTLG